MLAQVKLSFTGMTGARLIASRSIQLQTKKTARQQKTLEGHLVMVTNGERRDMSSRVAELDQIMPQYLGVSRAILDSVIFCHQDESLWPMSEPSVLKKKFDEIFDAMKYTKAIDHIKVLRKKQNEELAKFKIMEQHAKEDKDKADRAEKRSFKLQEEIEALREETQKLSDEMRRVAELADKAWKESENYAQVLGALKGKRIEAHSIEGTIDNLKKHLVELEDSDEWLETNLEQFESRQIQFQQQENVCADNYREVNVKIDQARRQIGQKREEHGKLENDKAHFERQLERRQAMIKEIARNNNIRGLDGNLSQTDVDDFTIKVQRLHKERRQALERAKAESQAGLREVQTTLNKIGERKSALQEAKKAAKHQIAANEQEIVSFRRKLDDIQIDESVQTNIESRLSDIETGLEREKERARTATWAKEMRDINAQLTRTEDESSTLNAQLIESTKSANDLARLDHLKKELKDRERSLETMKGAHGGRLSTLISPNWKTETLEREFQSVVDNVSKTILEAERDRDRTSSDLDHLHSTANSLSDRMKQKQNELRECADEVQKAIDDEPAEYEAVLKQRQDRYERVKEDSHTAAGMYAYLKLCMKAVESHHVCRTCRRGFGSDDELQAFRQQLDHNLSKEDSDDDLRHEEAVSKAVQAAGPSYNTWARLSETDIPALKQEEAKCIEKRAELLAQVEDRDRLVDERAEKKRDVESLSRTVNTIVRYDAEIKSFTSQIQDLQSKQLATTVSRTLEDIQEELAAVAEQSRALKRNLAKIMNDKEQNRTEINTLELEFRDVRSSLDNAKFQLEKKANLSSRVEEYKLLIIQQRKTMDESDRDIERLNPELSKAEEKHADISTRAEGRERELQQQASQLSDSLHQLDVANEDINLYTESGGPTKLEANGRELRRMENEIGQLDAEQASITREANRIGSQLKDGENTKRRYADNLTYRQSCRSFDNVKAEIRALEAQNAEVDRSRFKDESERRAREHNALAAKQASKMGEMKSKDDQLMQLLADWNTDYKDAGRKYQEALVKVVTTKAVVEDLGKYGGALDRAIMKYHGLKMGEINEIINELWQKTYRGTDVDTIRIRSDNENTKGNRSYNYRVCMVKQDAEMDMRGRCSAGQKVLASIIIRLALAECFGVNCGLIALDEPTTNLDRDNIRALATSLHDIIRARQEQANFQLIVITHDEEFLRHMQCGDFSDYYYRVSRNDEQKSIIERQSIAQVSSSPQVQEVRIC